KEVIQPNVCLPAVGQGALAIESRSEDPEVRKMLDFLNDLPTRQATSAERAFLGLVEGGCQVPIGVHADVEGEEIKIEAIIASLDGQTILRNTIEGKAADGVALAEKLGKDMLANGGQEILAAIL
ncbi:MAG: hydroxymethylbilane synthase, partial [Phascolarctobacterium sp.]|nr:hydroxymethylbilane synthase [Phascolarctobacterium sp.]